MRDSYDQLPDLFINIVAEVSPNENNVILYINGTSRSNNLTIILLLCGHNVIAVVSRASAHGRSTINLRRFMGVEWRLESFGKFI